MNKEAGNMADVHVAKYLDKKNSVASWCLLLLKVGKARNCHEAPRQVLFIDFRTANDGE